MQPATSCYRNLQNKEMGTAERIAIVHQAVNFPLSDEREGFRLMWCGGISGWDAVDRIGRGPIHYAQPGL